MTILFMVIGAGVALAAVGMMEWLTGGKWRVLWWHWVLMGLWGVTYMVTVAWLATNIGENEAKAGWLGFFILAVLLAAGALLLRQSILRATRSPAQKKTDTEVAAQ